MENVWLVRTSQDIAITLKRVKIRAFVNINATDG